MRTKMLSALPSGDTCRPWVWILVATIFCGPVSPVTILWTAGDTHPARSCRASSGMDAQIGGMVFNGIPMGRIRFRNRIRRVSPGRMRRIGPGVEPL